MKSLVLCMGSACFARGNDVMLKRVQEFILENTFEGLDVRAELCCEHCTGGPNMILDGEPIHPTHPDQLIELIQQSVAG
jgi:NADH:ubiquinone oxidoreductase subunit E